MQSVGREDIRRALAEVGVQPGQVVYLQADLSTVGRVVGAATREAFCAAYLDALFDLLGPDGTVAMPTYTTQVARFDQAFVWEETPTVLGLLPEYLRTRPGAVRSIHPLHSVTALGAAAERLCSGNSTASFGWHSPFHRLYDSGAKILTIGLPSGYAAGIAHHLEAACALPYVYNKLLKWKPIVGGRPVDKPFTATVRHLDLDFNYDLARHVRHLRHQGWVRSGRLGGAWLHLTDYRVAFDEATARLADDPFYLLVKPPEFTWGRIPFDGATAGRDEVAAATGAANWAGFYLLNSANPGGDEADLAG